MVLSSWRGHCKSSPDSFDEYRLSARWPPTLRPSQLTWAVSPPVGCYHPHPPSPLLVLLSPKADTHFTIPRRVKGWVDLGTAVRVCSLCPWLYIAVAVMINTTARDLSHHSEASTRLTTCRSKWVWTTCLMVFSSGVDGSGKDECSQWFSLLLAYIHALGFLQYFSTCLLDVMNGIQPIESYSSYCKDFFEGLCITWSSCGEEYCLNKTEELYM